MPGRPSHGSLSVEYNNTLVAFHCMSTHRLVGPPLLACLDGQAWNGTVPHCERRPEPAVIGGHKATNGGNRAGEAAYGLLMLLTVLFSFSS